MFNLIYRDGAPENAGHYEGFQKDAKATVMSVGELVSVTNGVASKYASGKPYGVVARASGNDEEEVAVLRITDDMIFRTVGENISTTIMPNILKGKSYTVSGTGVIGGADGPFEITGIINEGTVVKTDVKGTIFDGRFVDVE